MLMGHCVLLGWLCQTQAAQGCFEKTAVRQWHAGGIYQPGQCGVPEILQPAWKLAFSKAQGTPLWDEGGTSKRFTESVTRT